jgi:hypothetical protein
MTEQYYYFHSRQTRDDDVFLDDVEEHASGHLVVMIENHDGSELLELLLSAS